MISESVTSATLVRDVCGEVALAALAHLVHQRDRAALDHLREPPDPRRADAPDTVRRSRLCTGGSRFSIICRVKSRSSGGGSRSWVQPAQAENTSGVRLTWRTSSYRVTAQKPGPAGQPSTLGSGCHDTGSVDRSSANTSYGMPAA